MRYRLSVVAVGLLALPLFALEPKDARAEYDRLQKWQFSQPATLSAPVTITRDTATWTLTSGTVRTMEPSSDGLVSGFVFEGQGAFRMTIPDRYELAQLRRFTNRDKLESIDQTFTQLIVRTSEANVAKLVPSGAAPYAPYALTTKRHEAWLVDTFEDIDARIVAALLNAGDVQFTADMKTADFDWLTYHYDSAAAEEISVVHADSRGPEVWVSLDRPEERRSDGRPAESSPRASLDHIDVIADLTKAGRDSVGTNWQRTLNGKYVITSTFTGLANETRALRLGLMPSAKNLKAFDATNAELTVFRDEIGKRTINLDNDIHDDEFLVVLPAPLRKGEQQKIRFEYELETANYAPGGAWYPTIPDDFQQAHTGRLELTVRRKNELRAMGRMEKRTEGDGVETSVWIVDRPAKMITFSTATRFEEVEVNPGGVPPVKSFGPDYQFTNTTKLRNVAADVANSMQYFQALFDSKVEANQYYVTSIAAGHGQAFDGFLHMSEATFAAESPGASELFRAHEVAHAWWGHKVAWKSYRDQWLSEAFAEYSAMLFVRDFVKGGDKFFDEILRAYDGVVKGNLAGGFSKFSRPWLIEMNRAYRDRLGPIGHGWRASTNDVPAGYMIQTYYKGPLVVHMLRRAIATRTGSDDAFFKTLRDFLHEYDGKAASTEDFRRVLERNLGGSDMSWFFDAWIYRAEVPSYTWKYSVAPDGDAFALTVEIERRDVPDGFTAFIPIRLDFGGDQFGYVYAMNREAKQTITRKIPRMPKNVVFAPDSSLLASVKRN